MDVYNSSSTMLNSKIPNNICPLIVNIKIQMIRVVKEPSEIFNILEKDFTPPIIF